jgi:hypothetical protein
MLSPLQYTKGEGEMVKTLHCITIALLSALLVPLPLSARRGDGFFGSGGFGLSRFTTPQKGPWGPPSSLFGDSSYTKYSNSFTLTPAAESHGILRITLKTQDAEIYIDGRFVGLASNFNGTVMVSVPAGKHVVEFRYQGSSLRTAHLDIAPGSVTAIER